MIELELEVSAVNLPVKELKLYARKGSAAGQQMQKPTKTGRKRIIADSSILYWLHHGPWIASSSFDRPQVLGE